LDSNLTFDPLEYAAEFNSQLPPGAEDDETPMRFFSIRDGARLMIGQGSSYWMVCPGGQINDATSHAARYFCNGETDCDEITQQEAALLALRITGNPLRLLKLPRRE
jgi:hypothetical protein